MTTTTDNTHNGRDIVGQKIEIRKTGGEFSTDLLVANPDLLAGLKVGDRRTLAMDVVCVDEHFPASDRKEPDEGGLVQKFVFDPREVTLIDRARVAKDFDAQAAKVARAKEEAEQLAGQQRLATDEELHAAHDAGEHSAGLVDGCADCALEDDLDAAGN